MTKQAVDQKSLAATVTLAIDHTLQRAAIDTALTSEVPPIVQDVLHSPDQPLDARTRALMEPRFGHDSSYAHAHTTAKPVERALSVHGEIGNTR